MTGELARKPGPAEPDAAVFTVFRLPMLIVGLRAARHLSD
jgi:hypothetical protein